jgi:hypothetical protein
MACSPLSVHQYLFQTAAVAVASLASASFRSGDLSARGQSKSPACRRFKFDCAAFIARVRLMLMVKIIPPI